MNSKTYLIIKERKALQESMGFIREIVKWRSDVECQRQSKVLDLTSNDLDGFNLISNKCISYEKSSDEVTLHLKENNTFIILCVLKYISCRASQCRNQTMLKCP